MSARTFSAPQAELYGGIGFAITQWAHLEVALAEVYAAAVNSDNPLVATAGFFAVVNFNTKLAVVGATLSVRLHKKPDLLSKWQRLQKKLVRHAQKRNHLAHFMAHWYMEEDGHRGTLMPSLWDPMSFPQYNGKADRLEYTPADIETFRLGAAKSREELSAFASELNRELEQSGDKAPAPPCV